MNRFKNYSVTFYQWCLAAPGGTTTAKSATELASETKSDPSKTLTTYRLARHRSFRKERCNPYKPFGNLLDTWLYQESPRTPDCRNSCYGVGGNLFPIFIHWLKLQVTVAEESFHGISNLAFTITLTRPALVFNSDAILALHEGQFLISCYFYEGRFNSSLVVKF